MTECSPPYGPDCPFCTLPASRVLHTSPHGRVFRDAGRTLREPRTPAQVPLDEYVRWHVLEVFKSGEAIA